MKQKLLAMMLFAATLMPVFHTSASAQRIQQKMGRGVVAVANGTNVFVSWRRLAQEPENATYNVYVNGTKLNSTPLTNTHLQTNTTKVPAGASLTVTAVCNGVEGEASVPFVRKTFDMRNIFVSILFDGSPLKAADFNTAYVWPIDLDGDGEMDYVVNRKSNTNGLDCYVEGYLRTGEHLWTVKLGPNELSCAGQDDMITAADMDCDGRGDVIIQSSDGTQFWDPEAKTFGLYVNGSSNPDTDNDGIVDYETQGVRNAPRYISVIDGMTGREKASVEQTYNQHYNRTNRASLMGDEYNKHVGHMGVFSPDGIHPAVVMEWHMRGTGGDHHYYNLGVGYDFTSGKAGQLRVLFNEPTGAPAFHQIRVGDTDGDGRDEMIVGGYTMDHNGKILFNTGIAHGDRFRTSDIDPERPGLETFAVQQYAGDMLGQILYDAATGADIKRWYMPATGDVGRGECMDVDPSHLGWEMWSTMDGNMYDAQGNLIQGLANQYPCEGVWWDGELDREVVQTSDSHYNVYIQDFYKGREVEFAKISNWRYVTVYAKRAAFWGDIIGDWREELILLHKENGVTVGIVGVTTDYPTSVDNIYCLQEDPHYRGDCSTKGYYQSPNPGFYLGYDMPRPQLPPVMVTDLVFSPDATAWAGNSFTDYERAGKKAFADGQSVLFDLYAPAQVELNATVNPSVVYAMPVKNQRTALSGAGSLAGDMDLWKSQQGTFAVNVPLAYTGRTYISEGTLEVNSSIAGDVELRARGTLSGNAVVKGNLILEGALNYEGGRLMPGTPAAPLGTITLEKGLTISQRLYAEMDIHDADATSDLIQVNGDVTISGTKGQLVFTIVPDVDKPQPQRFKLLAYTGSFNGDLSKVSVRGLQGLSYNIVNEEQALWIVFNSQREASEGVRWTGAESSVWDYQTDNFLLGTNETEFVAGDAITVGDDAQRTTIEVGELMPVSGLTFENDEKTITVSGAGGFSGSGDVVMNGRGRVNMRVDASNYTGRTIINNGTVELTSLADGGLPSSIGAASTAAANFQIGKARVIINNNNTATNRELTLNDTASIQLPSGIAALKGKVSGKGTLRKEGNGQLNLTFSGANTYSGGTILAGGTLAMGAWNTTFGTVNSPIDVVGNATIGIFNNNSTGAVPAFQNALSIMKGKTLTMSGGQRCRIMGSLLGEGTLNISFPYVRGDFSMNTSKFEGTLNVSGQQFRLTAATDLSKATVRFNESVYVVHVQSQGGTEVNLTTKIGSLLSNSAGVTLSTGTWNVGYLGNDDSFGGKFTGAINKYGQGTLRLTAASTGALTVYEGTVLANCASASTTTGTTTVRSGGRLAGSGQVQTVTVQSGGTLAAGVSATSVGTLTINGNLNVQKEGIVEVKARRTSVKATSDAFKQEGKVTLNNPVLNIVIIGNNDLQAGDELPIFTGSGTVTVSGTPTITPAIPGEGLLWDSSRLASEGVLAVVADPMGIQGIPADKKVDVYSADGILMRHQVSFSKALEGLQHGVYIVGGKRMVR